jgi:hypothetical protein
VYCLRETAAPTGYTLDPAAHCTDGPVSGASTVRMRLVDRITPAPPVAQPVPEPPRTGVGSARLAQLGAAALLGGTGITLLGAPARPRCEPWPAADPD